MLQRHQRNNLDQLIAFAREELEQDFHTLRDTSSKMVHLSKTASTILDMYSNLSYPLIGMQVIKESLTNMKHPHALQIEMVLDKAELFYLESVKHDLGKLKTDQKIQHLSPEDIKEYIEEVNWKLGFQRESILNQSQQEIGDNIDLMKFFEGVRNYQNWEQNLEKRTIQKLKKFANTTQNELTLRKGFLISKIGLICSTGQKRMKELFVHRLKREQHFNKRLLIFTKIAHKHLKDSFSLIFILTRSKNVTLRLQQLFKKGAQRLFNNQLRENFKYLTRTIKNAFTLSKILLKIKERKIILHQIAFMSNISIRSKQKYQKYGRGTQKTNRILRRIALRNIIKAFGIKERGLSVTLENIFFKKLFEAFHKIIQYLKHKKALKLSVSQKIKGKILVSIQRRENKPINLRKTFLDWYLKTHQQNYSKKIYNIWLNGSISKFTFLMRIKNFINDGRKQKIRHELKIFLMVLTQNMGKYYNYCQKGAVAKWLERHRYCKKLTKFINKYVVFGQKLQKDSKKQGFDRINDLARKRSYLQTYFRRRLKIMQTNFHQGFNIWKALPNVKKLKGKVQLLNSLRTRLNQLELEQREVFNAFKYCKVVGKEKKLMFIVKVFTKDMVYLANFFNGWRRNVNSQLVTSQNKTESENRQKEHAIKMLSLQLNNRQNSNKKSALIKFLIRTKFVKRRKEATLKTFNGIINSSTQKVFEQSFQIFKQNFQQGKVKKNRLVSNLVLANKIKQAQSLKIWSTGAKVQKQFEKKRAAEHFMATLNGITGQNFLKILKDKYLFQYLNKFSNNYKDNVLFSLKCIRQLPPRINWDKKRQTIKLFDRLRFTINKDKAWIHEKFKQNLVEGRFRKKKGVHQMANKLIEQLKGLFHHFISNVEMITANQKFEKVIRVFDGLNYIQRNYFSYIFEEESLKKKKGEAFAKFNARVVERVRQSLKLWHATAKNLTYLQFITNQRKKRVLGILSKMFQKNQSIQSKKCVNRFQKNYKIIQVQINFLRKLCDSQAGKANKALMIWKNLPKPKNKQLVAKASKFERGLNSFAHKVLKTSWERFKDQHYLGNDRKKLAIRNLVARSCSGIQKYFAIWKKNNKLSLLFSQCHKLELFMESLMKACADNYVPFIQRKRLKQISSSFHNIENWWKRRALRALHIWREKKQLSKKEDSIKNKSLKQIANIQKYLQRRKIIEVLMKIKRQAFLRKLFTITFIQRRKNNFINAFKELKNLPDRIKIKNKKDKIKQVLQFVSKLQIETRNDKIKIWDLFRDQKYTGNFRKLKSCQSYLKDRISQVHKVLSLWLSTTRAETLKRKQLSVEHFFSLSQQLTISNFSQILQSVKATQLKKKCFEKLFIAMDIKKKGLFNIWRSKVKEIKLNKMLDDSKKKAILEKINKLISGASHQNVKKTVRNFYLNFKISSIQVKFIQKLLQTKSGKVLEAFNKWKKIPNQNLMEKYKKGQKFFFKLEGLIKFKLGQIQSCFSKNADQGSTVKKRSVLQLLQITSTGTRRYYNRWMRITKRDHTLKQAYSMMHSLDALHHCIHDNFNILFEDQRSTRIKTWAIERLIAASGQTTVNYFRKWRQMVMNLKMAQQFQKKEKSTALKMFANVLGGSESLEIRKIIEKFHKNAAISKISRNFLNRLLKTKSGKVVQLFQVWKSIPNMKIANKKKKAIKFQSHLHKIVHKFMKVGMEPFKISSHQARNKKRWCIQKLIRASMGEQKKKFLIWRQVIREQKIFAHTHLFDSVFDRMTQNLANSIGILIKNSKQQMAKKKGLCRRLINNASFVQHQSYLIWKEALQADNVKIQKTQSKVKSYLVNLINVNEKVQNRKLIQIISLFKKKQNFRNKIAADMAKQQTNRKAIDFYDRLTNFCHKNIGSFFGQVLRCHRQMEFLKRNSSVQKTFQSFNGVCVDNFNIVFRSNRQTLIMEKAINRIFDNFKVSTQAAFNAWRQHKNVLALQSKIDQQKKKNVLEVLNRCLASQEGIRIPYIISKFQKNYRSLKLRKQILAKILHCKAGRVPLAFMIWKSLPNPGAKKLKQKALKFQAGLSRLISQNLKGTYERFKERSIVGNNKKKLAVRKLILVTMSDSNRYFGKWRKVTSQIKITEKMLALTKFFQQSTSNLATNILLFSNFHDQNQRKIKAVNKLGQNSKNNLIWVINHWRETIKDQKCYKVEKVLEKFHPDVLNVNVLKHAFAKIKNKSEIETLRTYINSLWKWKMSNVEANYYAKFIKIFKESEQLITLSNCLNKKNYQNLHFAFRKIQCEGTAKFLKKYRIVQKYLLRKVNNYFQRFKQQTSQEEVKTWRNMYKSTIKGKKIIDLIERFARKQLYQSYKAIQSLEQQQKIGFRFIKKFDKLNSLFMKAAFEKIRQSGLQRCCHAFQKVLEKIIIRLKNLSFNLLSTTVKVNRLSDLMEITAQKQLIRHSFNKILQKATYKVKRRLAINLISYMEKQKTEHKIHQVIQMFRVRSNRLSRLNKALNLLDQKQTENLKQFYKIISDSLDRKLLLTRYKKAIAVKKILDKQQNKAIKRIFDLLKKKQNKWILASIEKFIVKSNLKSSMAVSLWRLKRFQSSQIEYKK